MKIKLTLTETIVFEIILMAAALWALDFLNYKSWPLFILGLAIIITCAILMTKILLSYIKNNKP